MTKKQKPMPGRGARKADLAALLSHELRTPLNAIIGFAEMLDCEILGNVGNQRYREYARHILDSGTHLHDIISNMLSVMADHGNAVPPEAEPIDPTQAVEACLSGLRDDARVAGVQLEGHAPDIRVRLLADQSAVTKILTMLVQDAISSARRGQRITVSVDLAARRRGLVYAIDRPAWQEAQGPNIRMAVCNAPSVGPVPPDEMPTDLAPAIWNWLVRLNGGRLDLDRGPDSGWAARVGFPERMLRRLRKSLDCGSKLASP